MSAFELYQAVLAGARVEGAAGAVLERQGELFVMSGRTGRHALSIPSTRPARLHAHWQGFQATVAAKVRP